MQHGASLRLLGLMVGLTATIAACSGAGAGGRVADRTTGPAAATARPTTTRIPATAATGAQGGSQAEPGASAKPAGGTGSAARTSAPTAAPQVSTIEATNLLKQIDELLGQADSSINADATAAFTMGE